MPHQIFSKSITETTILHYRTYPYSHDSATAIAETANHASVHGENERTARKTKILCPAEHAGQRIRQCRPAFQGDRTQGRHQPAGIQARLTPWRSSATTSSTAPTHPCTTDPPYEHANAVASMPTSRLTERHTPSAVPPKDVVDKIMHISTFFTEAVARPPTFHIPSAHGKLWSQYIFHVGTGTGGCGKAASRMQANVGANKVSFLGSALCKPWHGAGVAWHDCHHELPARIWFGTHSCFGVPAT